MAENHPDSVTEPVPGTPGIREVRSEMGSENFGFCTQRTGAKQGTRNVGLRAEIDTSPPFGSVKEAVTHFGGRGSWMPYYKLGESFGLDEKDIKKVEEQAAELEKDLIVKELETLDVLEALGTTKRIVEQLKWQLQKEAMRCLTVPDEQMLSSPASKSRNKENHNFHVNNCMQMTRNSSPCPTSSPDFILMELKQAKLNLGKTINDLGVIQTSVESLNKKMKKEKTFLDKMRERLTSNFAGVLSLEEELKQARMKPNVEIEKAEISEVMLLNELNDANLKTAELRLVAAKKMEEAARAAEAVALAEIKALSSNASSTGIIVPEPAKVASFEIRSPLTPRAQKAGAISKKKVEVVKAQRQEANTTKMSILKRLKEAAEEVKLSKQALEDALNKVEMANRKQFATEEALHKWMSEDDPQEQQMAYYGAGLSNFHFHQAEVHQDCRLNEVKECNLVNSDKKPALRSTVSMRDVLSRKQVVAEEYVAARPREERQKVGLSQMLQELREDLSFQPRAEKDGHGGDQKQFFSQRRKFGFIHISLPMTKASKKKMQDLNSMMR